MNQRDQSLAEQRTTVREKADRKIWVTFRKKASINIQPLLQIRSWPLEMNMMYRSLLTLIVTCFISGCGSMCGTMTETSSSSSSNAGWRICIVIALSV